MLLAVSFSPVTPVPRGAAPGTRAREKELFLQAPGAPVGNEVGAEADPQMCSKGNQGSLTAHHTREHTQLAQVPSTLLSQSIPQEAWRHGGLEEPAPWTVLLSLKVQPLATTSCSAWPCREMLLDRSQRDPLTPSSLLDVPTPSDPTPRLWISPGFPSWRTAGGASERSA